MCNHQSALDIHVLLAYLPFSFKFIAKRSLFLIPFFGWAIKRAGYISLDRENPRKALKAMDEAAKRIQDGTNILVFPEGTRSVDGNLLPFKKGAFSLALKARVPIVPVGICGTVSPVSRRDTRFLSRRESSRLHLGEPIPVAGRGVSYKDELAHTVRARMEELRRWRRPWYGSLITVPALIRLLVTDTDHRSLVLITDHRLPGLTMSDELKKEMLGVGLLGLFLFVMTCLVSYHPFDPSLNTISSAPVKNLCGKAGSYTSDALIQLFGLMSYLLAAFLLLFGSRLRQEKKRSAPALARRRSGSSSSSPHRCCCRYCSERCRSDRSPYLSPGCSGCSWKKRFSTSSAGLEACSSPSLSLLYRSS